LVEVVMKVVEMVVGGGWIGDQGGQVVVDSGQSGEDGAHSGS